MSAPSAGQHHHAHVAALRALAQHEGVLRADGDDQASTCKQTGQAATTSDALHLEKRRRVRPTPVKASWFSLSCAETEEAPRGPGTSAVERLHRRARRRQLRGRRTPPVDQPVGVVATDQGLRTGWARCLRCGQACAALPLPAKCCAAAGAPMQALQAEAVAELPPERGSDATRTPIPLAVNDDSLDNSVRRRHRRAATAPRLPVRPAHGRPGPPWNCCATAACLARSPPNADRRRAATCIRWARCASHAIASPAFARRHFSKGMQAEAPASAPMIVSTARMNRNGVSQAGSPARECNRPYTYLPSSTGFVDAAALGLAGAWHRRPWSRQRQAGQIVEIEPRRWLDVPVLAACRRAFEHVATHHPRAAHRRGQYPTLKRARSRPSQTLASRADTTACPLLH